MKAVVASFNHEKDLVGAFSVITTSLINREQLYKGHHLDGVAHHPPVVPLVPVRGGVQQRPAARHAPLREGDLTHGRGEPGGVVIHVTHEDHNLRKYLNECKNIWIMSQKIFGVMSQLVEW